MQNGSFVRINGSKIYRIVEDIDDAEQIIDAVANIGELKKHIVDTKVVSKKRNLLEHSFISPIIHSGEYTESMVYDVMKVTMDLIFAMLDNKIYSFDLLPHNFTYNNGKWVLFDFGAFETTPKKMKTQIRASFKITFSAFELLRIVERKYLKHYFLNRIKIFDLKKMIPFKNWLNFLVKTRICQCLYFLHLYKPAYLYLNKMFEIASMEYHNRERKAFPVSSDANLYSSVDKVISEFDITNSFGTGVDYANWTLHSSLNLKHFAYIDDYNICDSFYRHIYKNNISNVSTAVVSPLVDYYDLPENLRYSGLYDCFAQDRYISDSVLILNLQELLDDNNFDYETFAKNIVRFSRKKLVVRVDNTSVDIEKFKTILAKHYNNVGVVNENGFEFIVAFEPFDWEFDIPPRFLYQNDNRGVEDLEHSKNIINIIKSMKSN